MSYKNLRKIEGKVLGSPEKHTTLLDLNVTGFGFSLRIDFATLIHKLETKMMYSMIRDIQEELRARGAIAK
mgnify:FL=1